MSLLFSLIAHLLVTLARLAKPGGLGAVVAVAGGQTPAAHPEACAAACAVPDFMGSAGAGGLHAFGVTQTPEQDGCDTEAFHLAVLPPRPGEAQVSPALQLEKAPARRTQRSLKGTHRHGCRDETTQDCRANLERIRPSRSTRMSCVGYSSSTIDRTQAVLALLGSQLSGKPRTACGASTCFAANRFCLKATGSWS